MNICLYELPSLHFVGSVLVAAVLGPVEAVVGCLLGAALGLILSYVPPKKQVSLTLGLL